ncbi:MAG: GNAT family N-acetyltransferase [Nocardioidaceae bacterium]
MSYPGDVPVLTRDRVTLRAHTPADVQGVYEQCSDPLTQEFTKVPVPYTRDDAADFVAGRAEAWASGRWSFAVEAAGGAAPNGFAGSITVRDDGCGIGGIAYGAHPGVRGRGVMTTAVKLIVDWAFAAQGMTTITWGTNAGNLASWQVAWRNGFTFEGASRGDVAQRGRARDSWRGSLLAGDSREPKTRWLEPVPLTGERVVMRRLEFKDKHRMIAATTDPETMRWLGMFPFPRTAQAFEPFLVTRELSASLGQSVSWVAADPDTDDYLGSINLFGLLGLDYKSAEFGYWAHPDARGRSVVTEAVSLVAEHAFTPQSAGGLGLERLSLGAGDGNLASQRVARAVGFTRTGVDRRCYDLPDGSVIDLVRFDLLRPEFTPLRRRYG